MREYLEYLDAEMSKDSGYNDYQLKFLREQRESLAQSIQENGEK
jgi:hypothetical protein